MARINILEDAVVGPVVGAGHQYIAKMDEEATPARTETFKRYSDWYDLVAYGGGLACIAFDLMPGIARPVAHAGGAFLGQLLVREFTKAPAPEKKQSERIFAHQTGWSVPELGETEDIPIISSVH